MTDPVLHDHWIDARYPFAPSTDPPDDIDKALDALADAITRANDGERRSMAGHFARTPAVSKTAKVLSQLTASRLIAFLERQSGRDSGAPAALMPGIAASGVADRIARTQLFRRVTMAPRLSALQRACKAAALDRAGDRP
ncbi:hypothetical protein DFR50_13546 [Roseiarcus fermentans]|uniref:Uncharacterized protein n=1 Tax=Roseiarcus fermentans TaxID=1473586 RepID=A0A366ETL7_9HYPH|nr:hypothetical protein [Roseiarcus fermentans]RBP05256.1 hypothetical protein DFR50_13546 [Roseiarcus fermentans]